MYKSQIDEIILSALKEDSYNGDITSEAIFDSHVSGYGSIIMKDSGQIAGIEIFKRVFELIDHRVECTFYIEEGATVENKEIVGHINGPITSILLGERIALNFLQRLSGIASLTHKYVQAVQGYPCKIVDTRKTTPGLRMMEKYAITLGGGYNHRFNLSDAVMIKDNHIKGAGGIKNALDAVKKRCSHTTKIEVEIEKLEDLEEAIINGADIVMLDNMPISEMKEAVLLNKNRVILEASGNVSLDTVGSIAETGVSIISCGQLTHSVCALDISLKF